MGNGIPIVYTKFSKKVCKNGSRVPATGQNDEKRFILVVFKTWNLEAEKYLLNNLKTVNRPLGNSIGAQLVKTFL